LEQQIAACKVMKWRTFSTNAVCFHWCSCYSPQHVLKCLHASLVLLPNLPSDRHVSYKKLLQALIREGDIVEDASTFFLILAGTVKVFVIMPTAMTGFGQEVASLSVGEVRTLPSVRLRFLAHS
jgi:hypothetical protein